MSFPIQNSSDATSQAFPSDWSRVVEDANSFLSRSRALLQERREMWNKSKASCEASKVVEVIAQKGLNVDQNMPRD